MIARDEVRAWLFHLRNQSKLNQPMENKAVLDTNEDASLRSPSVCIQSSQVQKAERSYVDEPYKVTAYNKLF
jgi:hypothetical protein